MSWFTHILAPGPATGRIGRLCGLAVSAMWSAPGPATDSHHHPRTTQRRQQCRRPRHPGPGQLRDPLRRAVQAHPDPPERGAHYGDRPAHGRIPRPGGTVAGLPGRPFPLHGGRHTGHVGPDPARGRGGGSRRRHDPRRLRDLERGIRHVQAPCGRLRVGGRDRGSATQKIGFWGASPVVQRSGAAQSAITLGNTDGEIGGLPIGAAYTQAEVQALRDKCEELADDVKALSALVHGLRAALVAVGMVKGGA